VTPERHPATASAWEWLEDGPGKRRPEVDRARIRLRLAELDEALWALDRTPPMPEGWPTPAPLPPDYWESAE
jgi:hypothetical protein